MTPATSVRATLSRTLRQIVPVLLAFATATCTQDNMAPSQGGVGYFTFRPSYDLPNGASLAQFGIVADSIHIRLTRPVDQLVLDTSLFFPPDSTALHLALPLTLQQSPDTLDAIIEISSGGVVIFRDSIRAEVLDGPPSGAGVPPVVFQYVGPGTNIRNIDIAPQDTTVFLGDTVNFTAAAFDSSDAPVVSFYVSWRTSDTAVAKINANGRLVAPNTRASVDVIGTTPTGIADTTTVTFAPTPVIITADSGNAQSAQVGDSLPALFVARVKAADSLGVAGIPVRFAAVTAGATVRDTIVVTDAQGRARTRGVVDTVAGAYSWTATALGTGLPARTFTATATAGLPSGIALISGNGQVDTVANLLPAPFVVKVTDAFTNPVAGTAVVFVRTVGTGVLADDTVFTDAGGLASVGYTLGGVVGTDSVTATIAGTSASFTFHASGVAGVATHVQEFDGSGQSVAVTTLYPDSLVVVAFDSHDNPVAGAQVVWSIFSGQGTLGLDTTVTDSAGRTANTLTAGTLAGQLQVEVRALPSLGSITMTNDVVAGPAASLTIAAGNNQTAAAGLPLAIPPRVHAVDAFGNIAAGVAIDFAVTAGGGTIDSATATTDNTGDANAGVWTLGLGSGAHQVRATSVAVPSDTLLFDALALPAGTSKLWTAAINNSWALAGNWSPSGIPTTLDNVFVQASVASPVIPSTTGIHDLAIESGATVTLAAITFNVSGNAAIDGVLTGTGTLNLTTTGPAALHGNITTSQVQVGGAGNVTLDGPTTMGGALVIPAGGITVGGQSLSIGGTLNVQTSGQLTMSNAADSVDVSGTATFSTNTSGTGKLSAGVLVLRSNFVQSPGVSTNFAPSGTHRTRFLGSAVQAVTFGNPGSANSRFWDVEFGSAAGTTLNSTFTAMGTTKVTAGTVTGIGRTANLGGDLFTTYAAWQVSTTLWGASPTNYPDSLPRNVTVFNGWTLSKPFKTDSALVINSTGVLTLNGQKLRVGTTLTQGGVLQMQNASDSLDVGGLMTVNSGVAGTGALTDGHLILHQGFTQAAGAFDNFAPSNNFLTTFAGTGGHAVSFATASAANSHFHHLDISDSLAVTGVITVTGDVTLAPAGRITGVNTATLLGGLTDPSHLGWRMVSTVIPGGQVIPDSMTTNLTLTGSWQLPAQFVLTGNLTLNSGSVLTANGHRLAVSGTLTQSGQLQMLQPADTVEVGGAFTVGSGTAGTGDLVDGRLILHAGFSQIAGAFNNFAPSASHVTAFVGTGGHPISMATPSTANSHFRDLVVQDSLNASTSITVTRNTVLAPTGRVVGSLTGFLDGDLVDSSLAGWRMANTTFSGRFSSIPESLFTNVVLNDSIALAQPTTIIGNFALQLAGYIAFSGHGLGVSGNFTQNAQLGMNSTQDSLEVGGNFSVNSATTGTGNLTAGVIVLHGGFTQSAGSSSNFVGVAPHRVRFTGAAGGTITFANPSASRFGELEMDGTGTLTLGSDVRANGSFLKPAGGSLTVTAAAQRLLRVGGLNVDGLTLDRVRVQMNSPSVNAMSFDNVTFTNIGATQTQLSLELPGNDVDTLKLTNINFSGVPTTGRYLFVADSAADDANAIVAFYNSSPLNGEAFTGSDGTIGDVPSILWSHLEWQTEPALITELIPVIPAPEVRAVDPSGNLLTGYTGNVTLSFQNDPSGGGATLGGNSIAAVGGLATFDALTISLAGVGYTLRPSSPELGFGLATAPLTVDIPLPLGTTTAFNNGGGDNDWDNAVNWTFGVPDSADNVFILAGLTANVGTPARANKVVIGSGGGIVLNSSLTVDSTVSAGNTISGGGVLIAQGSGELSGQMGDLIVAGVYTVPTGNSLQAQSVRVIGPTAVLSPGQESINVADSLTTESGGRLNINYPAATVIVNGNARFAGGPSALISGTLELSGNFTQGYPAAFPAYPTFVTRFTGTSSQDVVFATPDTITDHFGSVEVSKNDGNLNFQDTVIVIGTLTLVEGGLDVTDTLLVAGDVTMAPNTSLNGPGLALLGDLTVDPTASLGLEKVIFLGAGQQITAAAYQGVEVRGAAQLGENVTIGTLEIGAAGQLDLAGHRLDVAGDAATVQLGTLLMQTNADTMFVGGNYTAAGGDQTGFLTAGLLQVAGNFTQQSPVSDHSFVAGGGHVIRFTGGSNERIISFQNPLDPTDPFNTPGSTFGSVEFTDGVDSLTTILPISGTAVVGSAEITSTLDGGVASLDVEGLLTVSAAAPGLVLSELRLASGIDYQPAAPTYQVYTTVIDGGGAVPALNYYSLHIHHTDVTLTQDLVVGYDLILGQSDEGSGAIGGMDLNGHTVTVANDFRTTGLGTFTMDSAVDSLDVAASIDLSSNTISTLTAGTIVARGSMYLSDSVIAASGTHKTVFAAAGSQQLWITAPHDNGNELNDVTVLAGATVQFNQFQYGSLKVGGVFWINGFFLQASAAQKVVALGDLYAGLAAGITVDTVELHDDLEIDASNYSTQLTRYAGSAQFIRSNVSYNDVEVTGSAIIDTTATTVIGRDLTVRGGGSLDLADRELDVGRTFRTLDAGTVLMTSTATTFLADTAVFDGGSTAGRLTAGTLRTRALIQGNSTSDSSYAPSLAHITQIGTPQGGSEYLLQMATGNGPSHIGTLFLQDGGFGNVPTHVVGRVLVTGAMRTAAEGSGGVIGTGGATLIVADTLTVEDPISDFTLDTLELRGPIVVPSNTFASPVTRFAGAGMTIPGIQDYQKIEVTGSTEIDPNVTAPNVEVLGSGHLTIQGGTTLTTAVFRTSGIGVVEMAGPTAQLQVSDTAVFAGGSTAGLLRQGFLTLAGDLIQSNVNSAASFAVDSQMYTTFTDATTPQNVTFATPGNAASHFGFVNIQFNVDVAMFAPSVIPVWGEMHLQGNNSLVSNGGFDVAQNMTSTSPSTVTAPIFIFRNGSAPDQSSNWNVGRTVIATPDTMNIPQLNYGGDLEIWTQARFVFPTTITGTLRIGGNGTPAYASWSDASAHAGALQVIDDSRFGLTHFDDSLVIQNDAHFDGGYLADQLTGGTIVFGRDVQQDSTWTTQSFGASGTALLFTPTVTHKVAFASPDNSPWPSMSTGGLGGDLNVLIAGRLVVAGGGLSGNGLFLSGDTLETSGPLDAGSSQLNVSLKKYVGPVMYQFGFVNDWTVTTTQFTVAGDLPFQDLTFDTLIVSVHVGGELSQTLKASYVEVTGPGNPRHIGDEVGEMYLRGGDGNTDLQVTGDVLVRGAGAHILNDEGSLSTDGNLTVDQDGYLYSTGSFGGGAWTVVKDVVIDGASTVDSLVVGSLDIGGNFIQKATTSGSSFAPDSGFTTTFFGAGTHVMDFATPTAAGSGGSYFGSLAFAPDAGIVFQTDQDLWVEGTLTTAGYNDPILQNTGAPLRTLTVRDVSIQGITFDHLQLKLESPNSPTTAQMDIVNFQNFLTTEDQFLVTLPGQAVGAYSWSNFTFTQLDLGGGDTGHYIVATDGDNAFPFLGLSIGTNFTQPGDLLYYFVVNGATITPFSP